jgi:hypothetical protein
VDADAKKLSDLILNRLWAKIGALVRISIRPIEIAIASGCPKAAVWGAAASTPRPARADSPA